MASLGSNTLMVVDSADDLTQQTRCLPRQMPVLKKLQWFWIFFGRLARAGSSGFSADNEYDCSVLFDSTSSSWYSSKMSICVTFVVSSTLLGTCSRFLRSAR